MEHQPINLATETIEQNFAHFLSQSTLDTSVENWVKQDFDDSLIETFKDKSAWVESKAKLAEAFSDLVNSEEAQEALKAQDQAVEAALDSIEEALLDFYKTIRYLSAEERQQGFAKASLHHCLLKLDKIDDVFSQAKRGFFNFPHLPRLTYLTAYILQAYLKLNPLEENSWVAEAAFGRINQEIEIAMEGVFRERHYRIKFELSGPYSNLAYVYDEHTKKSLTQWVELNEKARKVHDAHYALQERIADLYVQSLPFNQVSEMVVELWGQGETVSWATVKKGCVFIDLADESNAEFSASIQELALDWVKVSYFPEFSVAIQTIAVQPAVLGDVAGSILTEFLGGFLKRTGARLAFAAVTPFFAPGFGLLFRGIWGGLSRITRRELSDQNTALNSIITAVQLDIIRTRFTTCFNTYIDTFELVGGHNNYGLPENWLFPLSASLDLEKELLATPPPRPQLHYHTHQLLSEAIVMRLNILLAARGSAVRPGDEAFRASRDNDLRTMLNRWYSYLTNLLQQSYHATRASGDIVRRGVRYPLVTSYRVTDMVLDRRVDLSHPVLHQPTTDTARQGVVNRLDYFVTLNTELHNMCRAYDSTVRHLSKIGIRTDANPVADQNIFGSDFMQNRYLQRGNAFVSSSRNLGNWPGAHGQWGLLLFSKIGNQAAGPSLADHGVQLSPHSLWLSVGDYPDLEDSRIFNVNNLSGTRNLIIPVGLVAIVYDQKGFQGNSRNLPHGSSRNHSSHDIQISALRSMKVRVDVGNRWFQDKPNHHLGRLDTGFNYWPGGWHDPISPPLVRLP